MGRARRIAILSDDHGFQGRVFDLAKPLHLGFESYEQMDAYPDALYVIDVNWRVELLARRVESLNRIGDMLWTRRLPSPSERFVLSRYEWLSVITDVFLIRLISISDCAALLANAVFQCEISSRKCTIRELRKSGVSGGVIRAIENLGSGYQELRKERNRRFHHGVERECSDDSDVFRAISLLEHRGSGGTFDHRKIKDVDREYFVGGLEKLKGDFVSAMRALRPNLRRYYGLLEPEFERRFSRMFQGRTKPMPWEP